MKEKSKGEREREYVHSSRPDPEGAVAGGIHEDIWTRFLSMEDDGDGGLGLGESYGVEEGKVSLDVPGGETGLWVSEAWGGRRYTYSLGLAILTNALSPLTLFSIAAFITQVYTYHCKWKL